jgi:hypothetical protein
MTEPGDENAAGAGGRGHLRASHADREQVIGTLKAAYVQGMLAKDELDARVGQAFGSRTYADLAALTADLPPGLADIQPPRQPARAPARLQKAQVAAGAVLIIPPPALLLAAFLTGNQQVAMVFFLIVPWYFMAWIAAGMQILFNWHDKRSRGQLPPPSAQRRRPLDSGQDGRPGDDLILCQARSEVCARHRPGYEGIQRAWRSQCVRRDQRLPASLQVTA